MRIFYRFWHLAWYWSTRESSIFTVPSEFNAPGDSIPVGISPDVGKSLMAHLTISTWCTSVIDRRTETLNCHSAGGGIPLSTVLWNEHSSPDCDRHSGDRSRDAKPRSLEQPIKSPNETITLLDNQTRLVTSHLYRISSKKFSSSPAWQVLWTVNSYRNRLRLSTY